MVLSVILSLYPFSEKELFRDEENVERFLMGMASQSSEKEDHIIVEDLRGRDFPYLSLKNTLLWNV